MKKFPNGERMDSEKLGRMSELVHKSQMRVIMKLLSVQKEI